MADMSRRHIIISAACCITVLDWHYLNTWSETSAASTSVWILFPVRYYFWKSKISNVEINRWLSADNNRQETKKYCVILTALCME